MADEIKVGDTVKVDGIGLELIVKSIFDGKAACVRRGENTGKNYDLGRLVKVRGAGPRGPLRPVWG